MAFVIKFDSSELLGVRLGPQGSELSCYVPWGVAWKQINYGQFEGQVEVEGRVGETVVDHPDPVPGDAFGADHVVGHRVRVGDEQVGHPGRDPLPRAGEPQAGLVVAQAPAALSTARRVSTVARCLR